ncbi:phosphopantetheine-binding protein, partial [Frankia sp. Ag45/Mut15]
PTLTHFHTNLATLHTHGATTTTSSSSSTPEPRTTLPSYPFRHRNYWPAEPMASDHRPASATTSAAPASDAAAETDQDTAGATTDALVLRLASLDEPGREELLVELVRTQVAAVLGATDPQEVDPRRALKELGFDSLAAVSLRNRLGAATGLSLPTTLAFDHPSVAAVAAFLGTRLDVGTPATGIDTQLDRLAAAVAVSSDETERRRVAGALQDLLAQLTATADPGRDEISERIDAASDDDLFGLLDSTFGPL